MADDINQNQSATDQPVMGDSDTVTAQHDGAPPSGQAAASGDAAAAAAMASAVAADPKLIEAQAKAAEYYDAFLRSKAEMDNIRRRAQEDIAKAHKFAVEGFAESLLPVVDSLEAALKTENAASDAMRSGIELTLKQLTSAFEKNRLVPIDPAGQKFDPNLHQAISMVPSDTVPAQHVVATLQKGWTIAERVLRPALVTVSQGAPAASSGQADA